MSSMRPALIVLFALSGLAVRAAPALGQQPCANPVGSLTRVQYGVQLTRVATKTATAIADSTRVPVCSGDLIELGDNAKATLHIAGTSIPLDQNSRFTVTAPAAPGGNTIIELLRGALLYLSRVRRPMEIRTPFVTAAIEGTEFVVRVDDDRATVTVLEGVVRASNPAGALVLTTGQQAVAVMGQPPQLQVPVRPRDAVQWALYYEPLRPGDSFEQLPQVAPGTEDAAFLARRASLLLSAGRLEEARADLDRAQKLDPANGDVLSLRAVIAVALNDSEGALTSGRQAVERAPKSASALLAYSYALQASFDLEAARRTMEEAVAAEPSNASAWARLAELRLMLDDVGGAADAGERAAMLAPNLGHAHEVNGFTALAKLDLGEAEAAFDRALELEPGNPMAQLGAGLVKIRRGRLAEGRSDLETAVALNPNDALLRSYLGKAYYDEKRDAAAEGEFELAKALDPRDPTAFFYSAILKQSLNRPVEALSDFERSIELNDNRAVYRSRLLLDSDLAVRGARMARIHRDLGFEHLALLEGAKSLALSPGDFSAHRLLADSYIALPRHRIARDSELLQAQLLQPLNVNPVQPLLGDNGLAFLDDAGVSTLGFNEFTTFFQGRNQIRFLLDGRWGNFGTLGDTAIVSGLFGRVSYSVGQSHQDTDGIRINNDLDQNVYHAFVQGQLSATTSLQGEIRKADSHQGDLRLLFDPANFFLGRNVSYTDTYRLGGRHQFAPGSILIASYMHRTLDSNFDPTATLRVTTDESADFGEVRWLQRFFGWNVSLGVGDYRADSDTTIVLGGNPLAPASSRVRHTNVYAYGDVNLSDGFTLNLGLSYDDFESGTQQHNPANPKVGMTWLVGSRTTVRAGAMRAFQRTLISSQTLEPTQVAGFNQFFFDANRTQSWRYAVAIDQRLTRSLYAGIETTFRDVKTPILLSGTFVERPLEESSARAYLYSVPARWLAVVGDYAYLRIVGDPMGNNVHSTIESRTHRVGGEVRAFAPWGGFGRLRTTFVDQEGRFRRVTGVGFSGADQFATIDASIGYRLARQRGVVALDVQNIGDSDFSFQDTSVTEAGILRRRTALLRFTVIF